MDKISVSSEFLRDYLFKKTEEVYSTMIRPFNSFDKATYVIGLYKDRTLYKFTTTIYSEEESISILLSKWKGNIIIKITNGKEKVIYKKTSDYKYF